MGDAQVTAQDGPRRPPLVGVCGAADATADNERDAEEVTIALPTGLGELATAVLPRMVHGGVAIGKGYGTLTEVAHAIKLGRPGRVARLVGDPADAVDWLMAQLSERSARIPQHDRPHEITGVVQETQRRGSRAG